MPPGAKSASRCAVRRCGGRVGPNDERSTGRVRNLLRHDPCNSALELQKTVRRDCVATRVANPVDRRPHLRSRNVLAERGRAARGANHAGTYKGPGKWWTVRMQPGAGSLVRMDCGRQPEASFFDTQARKREGPCGTPLHRRNPSWKITGLRVMPRFPRPDLVTSCCRQSR